MVTLWEKYGLGGSIFVLLSRRRNSFDRLFTFCQTTSSGSVLHASLLRLLNAYAFIERSREGVDTLHGAVNTAHIEAMTTIVLAGTVTKTTAHSPWLENALLTHLKDRSAHHHPVF